MPRDSLNNVLFCQYCGKMMIGAWHGRKWCSADCLNAHRREVPKEENIKIKYSPVDNGNCHGCYFFLPVGGGWNCCHYLLITGKRRPCPPGSKCTVKRLRRKP